MKLILPKRTEPTIGESLRISNARVSFHPGLRQISFDMVGPAGRVPCILMEDAVNALCGPEMDLEMCWQFLQRNFNDQMVQAAENKYSHLAGKEIEILLQDIRNPAPEANSRSEPSA